MSSFPERQLAVARDRIKPGDILLCYLVRLSRWCEVLEAESPAFTDSIPIFNDPDPFIVRFKVKPIVLLELDGSRPMPDSAVWDNLEETKGITKGSRAYDAIQSISHEKFLSHMSDAILDEYEEHAEEDCPRDERQALGKPYPADEGARDQAVKGPRTGSPVRAVRNQGAAWLQHNRPALEASTEHVAYGSPLPQFRQF